MLASVLPSPIGTTNLNATVRPMGRVVQVAPANPPVPVEAFTSQMRFEQRSRTQPDTEYEAPSSGTTFATAVLSGALTPTPKTLSELYARIGASDIPDTMQMRLRDLLV
ncbi:MAG: hypothetical protein JWQ22_541 [Devosia sp.]|nr:hypothetical protein [Devosia sp.]